MPTEEAREMRAQQFRQRAIAEGMADQTIKETLFKYAADYEKLAVRAVEIPDLPDFMPP
jgi:hypothetical protein